MKKHKSHKQKTRTGKPPLKRDFLKQGFFASSFRNVGFGILLVVLFFSSMYAYTCFFQKDCTIPFLTRLVRHTSTVLMPQGALEVEVADTKSSRELGLSFRKKIHDDEGLLFVFDESGRYGFWMKDMKFSLDIIWINEKGVVVNIERNVTPETYPATFINSSDAKYVLEINEGLAKKFGVYLGSKVKIVD